MDIKVVSETIDTHVYESQTLAKAFSEITGINLTHDLIQEGDVIEKLQTQMQSDQNIYDAYINDSDLVGTHFRYNKVVPLSDWMTGDGKDVTLPTLDVDDFMGKSFTTGPGRQALPAPRPAVRQPLLVPLRLVHRPEAQGGVQEGQGLRAGRAGQLVGLRGHRRLLHQPREGDRRRPRLRPHGLRQEGPVARLAVHRRLAVDGRRWATRASPTACRSTSGASAWRAAGRSAPASPAAAAPTARRAVYALQKYIDWLKAYAPPEAPGMTFSEAGPVPGQGAIAQQIFWYSAFTAVLDQARPAGDERGRHAQVAHGAVAARPLLAGGR